MLKGFININKPANHTSSDVVIKVRGILRKATGEKQKVGHFGTLDPIGTGVLPIAVGTATRLFDYSLEKVKVYKTTFKFGIETDTLDLTGKIEKSSDKIPSKDEILDGINKLIGKQNQIPPKYSSKSINGKRAYDLAREGKEFELKGKDIEIYSIQVLNINGDECELLISCSGGTYIRSIARDLGYLLGTYASMKSIHRVKSGDFEEDSAVSIEEFEKDPLKYLIDISVIEKSLESFEIPEKDSFKVLNGIKMEYDNLPENYFIVKNKGEIIGIGESLDKKLNIKTRL